MFGAYPSAEEWKILCSALEHRERRREDALRRTLEYDNNIQVRLAVL